MSYSQIWCIAFFGEIKVTFEHVESVKMSGFSKFELRDKVARSDKNPKTGQEIPITARRVVNFRLSGLSR